jgi:hypothetical protein
MFPAGRLSLSRRRLSAAPWRPAAPAGSQVLLQRWLALRVGGCSWWRPGLHLCSTVLGSLWCPLVPGEEEKAAADPWAGTRSGPLSSASSLCWLLLFWPEPRAGLFLDQKLTSDTFCPGLITISNDMIMVGKSQSPWRA